VVESDEDVSPWDEARVEIGDGYAVIRLADGGLMPVLEHVQRELEWGLVTGRRVVVLDLGPQPEATLTAVAAVVWVTRVCARRGVRVVLDSPSPAWSGVLQDILAPADVPSGSTPLDVAVRWPPLAGRSQCGTW
jgi:hypothetical protein